MEYNHSGKSPYFSRWGLFISGICLFFLTLSACGEKPSEVLQTLEDGTVIRRHFEIDGKMEGQMTDYYQSGQIKGERWFVDGIQQGRSVWYYPGGSKKESQEFLDGLQTGVDSIWMEDGKLQRIIHFKAGKKHGPMQTWNKHGQLILEVIFSQDSLITVNKSIAAPDTIRTVQPSQPF